jgi:tetratricopeptide (TPR) repeat protein
MPDIYWTRCDEQTVEAELHPLSEPGLISLASSRRCKMQGLVKALFVVSLMVCVAGPARPDSLPDVPKSQAVAMTPEQKGDLARVHKDFYAAVDEYLKALRAEPKNAVLYNKLAIAEFQLGEKSAARKHLSEAIKLDPDNAVAFNNLVVIDLTDSKYKASVKHLKQALALDESSATAHVNMAEAWMGLKQVDRAMTEYSRALELNADILNSANRGVVAQVTTPEQRAYISFLIAKLYAKKGNIDGALEYLRRAKDDRFPDLSRVYSEKEFAALWTDPRLEKIVKR